MREAANETHVEEEENVNLRPVSAQLEAALTLKILHIKTAKKWPLLRRMCPRLNKDAFTLKTFINANLE